jgi:hypothetical protein
VGDPGRIPARRFRGYRLVDAYPEFRYEVDGIEVSERITVGDEGGLVRHFIFAHVDRPLWFVDGASGRKMEIGKGSGVTFTAPLAAGGRP